MPFIDRFIVVCMEEASAEYVSIPCEDGDVTSSASSAWLSYNLYGKQAALDGACPKMPEDEARAFIEKKRPPYLASFDTLKSRPLRPFVAGLVAQVMNPRVAQEDPLANFLRQHDLVDWTKRAGARRKQGKTATIDAIPVSHTSLQGGVIKCQTPEQEKHFRFAYARSLSRGSIHCLCERPTPDCMRLMMDLDMKSNVAVPTEFIELLVNTIQTYVIAKFFPTRSVHERRVVVCGAPIKTLPAPEDPDEAERLGIPTSGIKKTGVHLAWTDLFASAKDQLNIRYNAMLRCEQIWGTRRKPSNPWSDVVDKSVYRNSGLRLIGSNKVTKCPLCNGKGVYCPQPKMSPRGGETEVEEEEEKKEVSLDDLLEREHGTSGKPIKCPKCNGKTRLLEMRPYVPMMVLDGNGERCLEAEKRYLP